MSYDVKHHISVPHVRATFGNDSPITKAAALADQLGKGDAKNDNHYGREDSLVRDPFLPGEARGAYAQLHALMPDDKSTWSPKFESVFAGLGQGSSTRVQPDRIPVALFAGTDLEAAVATLAANQVDHTVLYKATVDIAKTSAIFGNSYPGALGKLDAHFREHMEHAPPPPFEERLVKNEPGFVVWARVDVDERNHRSESVVIHTKPNAIISRSESWLSTRTHRTETWRADANGHFRLPHNLFKEQTIMVLDGNDLSKLGVLRIK
jgi:hypothetical protein